MMNALKPISAALLLLPLTMGSVGAWAQTAAAAPVREASSVNRAVSSLMAGGAPVQGTTEKAPALTPEQAVQKAIQGPAVVGAEPLKADVAPAAAAPAPAPVAQGTLQAEAPAQAEGSVVVTPKPKAAEKAPVADKAATAKAAEPVEVVKPKPKKKRSALTWNEKAANTAGISSAKSNNIRPNEYEISDTDYNRFVFPVAVAQVVSPAGANLLHPPLYMANNKHVLLRLASTTNRPVQVVAELEDGSVQEFFLKSAPIRGVVKEMGLREHRVASARAAEAAAASAAVAPSAVDMQLLERFVMGQIPPEFEEAPDLPPEVHFERFWVKPIAVWTNAGNTRVEAWRLVGRPGLAATVAPPQFYRPGVRAVMLENDVVDGKTHPLLLLVTDNVVED